MAVRTLNQVLIKITYSMITYAGPAGEEGILDVINACWALGKFPTSCKKTDIILIPKPKESSIFGPISLTPYINITE